jgi:hypothetical protein
MCDPLIDLQIHDTRASSSLRAASAPFHPGMPVTPGRGACIDHTGRARRPDWTDAGYFSVGSNAINESITPSAVVCHLSHTKWLLDSKLVAPWAAVSSNAP